MKLRYTALPWNRRSGCYTGRWRCLVAVAGISDGPVVHLAMQRDNNHAETSDAIALRPDDWLQLGLNLIKKKEMKQALTFGWAGRFQQV